MKRNTRLFGLLSLPLTWLIGIYIGSLTLLIITAFWTTDPFTSKVKPGFTLRNFEQIFANPAYLSTALRTLAIALVVTAVCIAVAIPLGIFISRVASERWRPLLIAGITLPLWAGYLVKVLAMRVTYNDQGLVNWLLSPLGISGPGFSEVTVVLTLVYLWFPYMAIPVATAIAQIPDNLLDASADLGATARQTIMRVIVPQTLPAIAAGSIFTFSLSLGDYIAAKFVGGATQMVGSVIASNINLNPPLAAAFAVFPIVFVIVYLMLVRRTGALERM